MDSAARRQKHAGDARLESQGREANCEVALTGFEAGVRVESPLGNETRRAAADGVFKPRMTIKKSSASQLRPSPGASRHPLPKGEGMAEILSLSHWEREPRSGG